MPRAALRDSSRLTLAGLLLAACGTPAPPADAPLPPPADAGVRPADLVDGQAAASVDGGAPSALAPALVGVYAATPGGRPPTLERVAFRGDGTFVVDADTGVRCVTAPCPSHVVASGHFTAEAGGVELRPHEGDPATEVHGRYRATVEGSALRLAREGGTGAFAGLVAVLERVPPVLGDDVVALVASSQGGGFVPQAPKGSTCTFGQVRYRFERKTRTLAFRVCERGKGAAAPLAFREATRTLDEAAAAKVEAAARAVTPSSQSICGTDKPLLELETESPAGARRYADAFYSCRGEGRVYVEGLDALFATLQAQAK